MALELLIAEAQGMSEESLMEVLRFMKFIKIEQFVSDKEKNPVSERKSIREAGIFKESGKYWMADDFNDPIDDFEEYM